MDTSVYEELMYWMAIALEKDENGYYKNGEAQKEACKHIDRIRGISETIDTDYEIIQPKQITYDRSNIPTCSIPTAQDGSIQK